MVYFVASPGAGPKWLSKVKSSKLGVALGCSGAGMGLQERTRGVPI